MTILRRNANLTLALQAGDSGAWVIDSVTQKVYGHLVASAVFGRGYVVPICDSFEDIKDRLSADLVCLPSEADILTFNARYFRSEPVSHASYQPNPLVAQLFPIINASLQSIVPPFQVSQMPEYPQPSYHSSGASKYTRLNFPSSYTSSSHISGSYYDDPFSPYDEYELRRYQEGLDSGYSSMNSTPESTS